MYSILDCSSNESGEILNLWQIGVGLRWRGFPLRQVGGLLSAPSYAFAIRKRARQARDDVSVTNKGMLRLHRRYMVPAK